MRRAPFQALAAISVLLISFFVTTLLAIVVYSSHQLLVYFETRPQVIAFIAPDTKTEEVEALKKKLEEDSRIESVTHVSKEEALDLYKEATSDNPLLRELVSPSIFPESLEFSVSDLKLVEEVINEIKDEEIVESVSFTANIGGESSLDEVVQRLKSVTNYIRYGGAIAVSVLILTSLLVLMVVIGMRVATKKKEIENLFLIGAGTWFIRAPIIFEAINYVVIGVFFGWLMASVLVMYATPSIFTYFGEIPVLPKDTVQFFLLLGAILAVELIVGILIALLGSLTAVSRSIKVTK